MKSLIEIINICTNELISIRIVKYSNTMENQLLKLKLNFKFWIEDSSEISILGNGKWQLIQAIEETGSLKEAFDKLGLSYRKTWNNLKKIEQRLGFPLIETKRGGTEKGGSILTPEAKKLIDAISKIHAQIEIVKQTLSEQFQNELK